MSDFLVWSNQHGMWWRPDRSGYTQHIEEAGRYTRAEADAIVRDATVGGQLGIERTDPVTGREYRQFTEVIVLAPEAAERLTNAQGWDPTSPQWAVIRAGIAYRNAVNDATGTTGPELLQALITAVDDLEGTDSRG